jgi:hypothetical protein
MKLGEATAVGLRRRARRTKPVSRQRRAHARKQRRLQCARQGYAGVRFRPVDIWKIAPIAVLYADNGPGSQRSVKVSGIVDLAALASERLQLI